VRSSIKRKKKPGNWLLFHQILYSTDWKTQSEVERQLGINGEAENKFDKLLPVYTLENAGKIVGFRNRLMHHFPPAPPLPALPSPLDPVPKPNDLISTKDYLNNIKTG
jgi:hypothetical protein